MELQLIPARSGTATFLPAGKIIKIVNTSGTQVIDTWAFALPKPDRKKGDIGPEADEEVVHKQSYPKPAAVRKNKSPQSKRAPDLPPQEEAERATRTAIAQGEGNNEQQSKKSSSWTGYLPSVPNVPLLGFGGKSKEEVDAAASKDQRLKDSKTWSSYFAAGKGFSSYIPQQASETVTQFAGYHARDDNKTYLQQLQDFSKTPVGAAGMAAISGSGYGSSLYAGYSAWNSKNAANIQAMEYLSMPHSRASSLHLTPQVQDTLVTNLREPILTFVEDTSPGTHDTLISACDPKRYKQLGAPDWEKHGSCAENLVLALKELNDRAGLKGVRGVGADVSVNTVPAPLNLFMNVSWEKGGELRFGKPKSKAGDYVRFLAERDVVVVMSACPQDITDINGKDINDAHFIVEDIDEPAQALKRAQPRKKSMPRKISSSQIPAAAGSTSSKRAAEPDHMLRSGAQDSPAARDQGFAKLPPPRSVNKNSPPTSTQKAAGQDVRPRRKPIPPSGGASANGEAAALVEKKKPRKLLVRSQTSAGA